MTDNYLNLFCLVDGKSTSEAFFVEIESTETISCLKDAIKAKQSPDFSDVAADKLTLWRVSVPISEDDDEIPILLDNVPTKNKKILVPVTRLSKVFPRALSKETVHIMVQRPPRVPKRDREEDAGPSFKRMRLHTYALRDATEEASQTEKAVTPCYKQ
ncbi:hypothetical protein BG000_011524 [Podila horticola]|nr:hypothetical protein BG000_011524 [Podila horticola]